MSGYCAKCGRKCEGQNGCLQCSARIIEDGGAVATVPLPVHIPDETPDGPSFWRRLTLGGITLFGLFQALMHLTAAGALAVSDSSTIAPEALLGLFVAATLAASVVAGTVNRRAELTGLLLGLGAACGWAGLDVSSGWVPPIDWLVGMPVLLVLVGTIGGLAGRLMIPPAPKLPKFGKFDSRLVDQAVKSHAPLVWWRMAAGAVLAIVGTVYSDAIRQGLAHVLSGHASSFGSARLLTWQISVICGFLGGVFAGCSTRGGLRQGLFAGIAASAGVVIWQSTRGANSPLLDFWLEQLDLDKIGPAAFGVLGASVLVSTTIGGWLGAHILPAIREK